MLAISAAIVALILVLIFRKTRSRDTSNEPPLLPSSFPIFRHVFRYAFELDGLYKDIKKFSPDSKPVSLDFMGQRIYLVLSQNDTNAVCKEKTRLAYGPLLDWALPRIMGISQDGLRVLKQDVDGPHTNIFDASMGAVRHALNEGPSLDEFTESYLSHLRRGFEGVDHRLKNQGSLRVRLFSWMYELAGTSSSHAMMGSQLLEYDNTLLERNRHFEDDFFLFALGLPRWITKAAWSNRTRLHEAFEARHNDSNIHGNFKAAWWVDESERLSADVGQNGHDVGTSTFGFWHALQSNPNNVIFWMLAHIVSIPRLMDRLRQETGMAFESGTSRLVDLNFILDEDRCPLFHSTYHEALRYTSTATVTRMVTEDTIISGYTFHQGAVVLCPARLQHFDPDIWGPDVDEFIPDRFIRNSGSSCIRGSVKHLHPFGNAPTICPGRFFALRQILSLVGSIIQGYDIKSEGGCIPRPHLSSPSFGTVKPAGDMEVIISRRS